jgi:hypothetical protein
MTILHRMRSRSAHNSPRWVVEDVSAGTFRVHRSALTDEAVFRDEMRSIFDRCWLYVGHESEIPKPGDFRARDVGNRPLVFWHGHDGVRRVFYNSCRHRGALVCRVPRRQRRGVVRYLARNVARVLRPALHQLGRKADACLLASLAEPHGRRGGPCLMSIAGSQTASWPRASIM